MKLVKKANLIMYRFREKGLEIFLVNKDQNQDQWEIPIGELDHQKSNKLIEGAIKIGSLRIYFIRFFFFELIFAKTSFM